MRTVKYNPPLESCPKCHAEVYIKDKNVLGYIRIQCTGCKERYTLIGCRDELLAPKQWKAKIGSGYFDN